MKKADTIAKYGEGEYARRLAQRRARYKAHKEQEKAYQKKYNEEHPEQARANDQEASRKGGKYYDTRLEYGRTGIPGDKNKIRSKHQRDYKPYKDIIAPDSQIHHEWVPQTADYRGVALVEANAHQYGIIDVIEILDGKITLLTEEEVKNGRKRKRQNNK